jgi:hypothetical protein
MCLDWVSVYSLQNICKEWYGRVIRRPIFSFRFRLFTSTLLGWWKSCRMLYTTARLSLGLVTSGYLEIAQVGIFREVTKLYKSSLFH